MAKLDSILELNNVHQSDDVFVHGFELPSGIEIEDFADNFDYDLYEERGKAKKCFYGCERAYDNLTKLFGTDGYEMLNAITYGL